MEPEPPASNPEARSQVWLERLNRALLDSALDCVITMDTSGRILEFNASAERVFGFTRAQAVGQNWRGSSSLSRSANVTGAG